LPFVPDLIWQIHFNGRLIIGWSWAFSVTVFGGVRETGPPLLSKNPESGLKLPSDWTLRDIQEEYISSCSGIRSKWTHNYFNTHQRLSCHAIGDDAGRMTGTGFRQKFQSRCLVGLDHEGTGKRDEPRVCRLYHHISHRYVGDGKMACAIRTVTAGQGRSHNASPWPLPLVIRYSSCEQPRSMCRFGLQRGINKYKDW